MAFGIPSTLANAANVISAAAGLSTMTNNAKPQTGGVAGYNPGPWYRPDNLMSTLWAHKFLVGGVLVAGYFVFFHKKGRR